MKTITSFALVGMALVTGCASTPPPSASTTPTASTAPVATAVPAAPSSAAPLVPFASAKRVVLKMTGPSSVTQAKDWAAFREEWRATFAEHAKAKGVAFELQQGDVRPSGAPGTVVDVYVNDYRMVGIGARVFFGVMTGNAYIDAKASFSDLGSSTVFGERVYNTSSSAWSGVFAKVTPQQVDAIGAQVFGELASR